MPPVFPFLHKHSGDKFFGNIKVNTEEFMELQMLFMSSQSRNHPLINCAEQSKVPNTVYQWIIDPTKSVNNMVSSHRLIHSADYEFGTICQSLSANAATAYTLPPSFAHRDKRLFKCQLCLNIFEQYDYLIVHMRSHNICNECGKCFSQSGNLTVHKRTHSPKINPLSICRKCNKIFIRMSN